MIKDRGNKKWQGFFMPEHISLIRKLDRDSQKQPRPELDPSQIEEMETLLQESIESGTLLEITTWQDGIFKSRVGMVTKLKPIEKKIGFVDELDCTFNLSFYSITDVKKV